MREKGVAMKVNSKMYGECEVKGNITFNCGSKKFHGTVAHSPWMKDGKQVSMPFPWCEHVYFSSKAIVSDATMLEQSASECENVVTRVHEAMVGMVQQLEAKVERDEECMLLAETTTIKAKVERDETCMLLAETSTVEVNKEG
jgi:hypothetical protein